MLAAFYTQNMWCSWQNIFMHPHICKMRIKYAQFIKKVEGIKYAITVSWSAYLSVNYRGKIQ